MKKVLIITFHFLKGEKIGSIRARGLAKYLPQFGWEPTILTSQVKDTPNKNFHYRIITTEYDDIVTTWIKRLGFKSEDDFYGKFVKRKRKNKKLWIDYVKEIWELIFAYPDINIGWYKHAVKAGHELLKEGKFDAILSSSKPETCHLVANNLKNNFDIPWIADFRDLWTQNKYEEHFFLRNIFEKRLEFFIVSNADIITTVSNPLANILNEFHSDKKIYTIMNGFDPDQKKPGIKMLDKFTIVYTGVLYQGKRDPEPLFQAISELINSGKISSSDIEILFFGTDDDWLFNDIRKYKLENVINVCGPILREESILQQRKAQVLLLLTWNHPGEKGVYTGKLFDYLAAQRPILAIGIPGSVIEELFKSTKVRLSQQPWKLKWRFPAQLWHNGFGKQPKPYREVTANVSIPQEGRSVDRKECLPVTNRAIDSIRFTGSCERTV
jgi:hypothetical protein